MIPALNCLSMSWNCYKYFGFGELNYLEEVFALRIDFVDPL